MTTREEYRARMRAYIHEHLREHPHTPEQRREIARIHAEVTLRRARARLEEQQEQR